MTETQKDRPAILGHRGALMHAPENTLAAFELCVRCGVDIELDVYSSKDNQLVVIHDATVDRTTNGKGRVDQLTLEQLKALDAGSWFHPDFAGERIPTFDETLAFIKKHERRPTVIGINLKPVNQIIISGIVEAVRKHEMLKHSFLFDMSLQHAQAFKKLEPRIRCAASAQKIEDIRSALKLDYIDVIWTGPKSKPVSAEIHAAGRQVIFTIVNDAKQWLRFNADGVDGICTNHPLEMKQVAWPPPAGKHWDHYLKPEQRKQYRYKGIE